MNDVSDRDDRDYIDSQIALVSEKIHSLNTVSNERLSSITTQFAERDVRGERERRDGKVALDAAFSAQKETVNKLSELFKTTTDALTVNINDLKERIVAIEATKLGANEKRDTTAQTTNIVIGFVGLVITAVIFAVGLYLSSKGVKR